MTGIELLAERVAREGNPERRLRTDVANGLMTVATALEVQSIIRDKHLAAAVARHESIYP